MLNSNAWKKHEPRVHFPVFSNMENHIDITLQDPLPISIRKLGAPAYHWLKKRKSFIETIRDYQILLTNPAYRFRGIFVDRNGNQLAEGELPGSYKAGDYFVCHVNDWLESQGQSMVDGTFILIANHGRPDLFNSSPGNASLRAIGKETIAGYRTGFFSRTLNDGKRHYGFTGLNPQIEVNDQVVASLLFINHSSNPEYNQVANPTVRLYRNLADFTEVSFGEIPAHSAKERSLLDLFPNAAEFLKDSNGLGFSITSLKGASLASLHVLRRQDGELLSIEHSRPAYPNIVKYF